MSPLAPLMPVLVHIQTHLHGPLSLADLAQLDGRSASHFHRRFSALVGETPQKYVQRLRIERAAFLLRFTDSQVTDIAFSTGFASHEVFTRAFTRRQGMSPSAYRRAPSALPAATSRTAPREDLPCSVSALQVFDVAPQHLAFVRQVGPYEDVDPGLFATVQARVGSRRLGGDGTLIGLGHDAPGITPDDKLRFDAAVAVAGRFAGDDVIHYQHLPGGPHACVVHVGPLRTLPEAYVALGQGLAQLRRYRPLGPPALEVYRTTRITDGAQLARTEVMLPVARTP